MTYGSYELTSKTSWIKFPSTNTCWILKKKYHTTSETDADWWSKGSESAQTISKLGLTACIFGGIGKDIRWSISYLFVQRKQSPRNQQVSVSSRHGQIKYIDWDSLEALRYWLFEVLIHNVILFTRVYIWLK